MRVKYVIISGDCNKNVLLHIHVLLFLEPITVNSAYIFLCLFQREVCPGPCKADKPDRNHEKSPERERQLPGAQGVMCTQKCLQAFNSILRKSAVHFQSHFNNQ